ncbi:MAG TPA: sigma 54-interacting transcriptional regulator, partial [Myxococcaceae bacterium]|nr:sigma 54-interacting transcriptional regulator [Myxococcaceae bacterium]
MPASRPDSRGNPLVLPALEALAGPTLLVDAHQRVTAATPEAEERLGPIVPGRPLAELLTLAEGPRALEALLSRGREVEATVRAGGKARTMRVRAVGLSQGSRRLGWAVLLGPEMEGEQDGAVEVFHGMWTRDAGMKRMFRIVEKVAHTESSVLVRGESGTGKELVANALHEISERRKGPFRAINCAALPPNLLESELFGHVRGAFTGAVRDSPGHFRLADGGTLFLDEVAELPLDLQAKLLRVLETRTIIPVGGRQPVPVNVRIVAATHRALRREVEAGRFRADLMYRLRVVPLFLPPLRERRGDILPLARRFLDELEQQGSRRVERFSPGARRLLESHSWAGNVRELRNVMEYAYVIGEGPVLREADLPPEFSEPRAPPLAPLL